MDLTGLSGVKFEHVVDPDTGVLTLTLKTPANMVIGEIVLDQYKARPFFDALAEIMEEHYPDSDHNVLGRRATIDLTKRAATLYFG